MDKTVKLIKHGLNYHFKDEILPGDVLVGDDIIFNAFLDFKPDNIEMVEELKNEIYSLILTQLEIPSYEFTYSDQSSGLDKGICDIVNRFENKFASSAILYLNSGMKKMLRGKMLLKLSENYQLAGLIELFHLGTLIQDDVIDHAKYRRHLNTLNYLFNDKVAILVSDILMIEILSQFKSLNLLDEAKVQEHSKEKYVLEIFTNLIKGMLNAEMNASTVTNKNDYEQYAINKTGNLFGFTLVVGLFSKNEYATREEILEINEFGQKFGLLFQKVDDYLDYFSTIDEIGKENMDEKNAVFNFCTYNDYDKVKMQKEINHDIENLKKNTYFNLYEVETVSLLRRISE